MKKLSIYAFAAVCLVSLMQACNDDTPITESASSDTIVYSFGFQSDSKVMERLDTVFFSIDLIRGEILNADSMPYGTNISKLVPAISVVDNAQAVTLSFRTEAGNDTLTDYLTNPGDSINFSNGPVTLSVMSPGGTFSRSYSVRVNVHKVVPDTLVWGESAFSEIPSGLSSITAQRTVANDNGTYCLTTDGSSFSLAHTTSNEMSDWQHTAVTLPADADLNSFAAAGESLYILDNQGALYESADGSAWTATGRTWKYIYGDCIGNLGGAALDGDGNYIFEQYPSGASMPIPAEMPVAGASVPVSYKAPMASEAQCVIVGGRKADGTLTGHAWGFDGNSWVKVSNQGLPHGLEGVAVVPFFTYYINKVFIATELSVFMAFGGTDGTDLNTTVYITQDFGMTWTKAPELAQVPESVSIGAYAQGFMRNTTLYPSRATRPVQEWECPYIYMFGGVDAQGQLYNSVWRGTLNRMTFKPLI